MYTSEILARAGKGQARGFSRPADLVPLLNTAVQVLYKHECPQTMLLGTTGRPPYLTTTALNYGPYNGPAGTWRVSNLLIWDEQADSFLDYMRTDYGMNTDFLEARDFIKINGNRYFAWRHCHQEDALEGGLPQIMFSVDPGATTSYFHMQAYRVHPAITSDRIQLQIPDSEGAHQTIVIPALIKMIEGQNHGNYIEAIEYIEQTLKPRLWKIMGSGAQGKRHETIRRPW